MSSLRLHRSLTLPMGLSLIAMLAVPASAVTQLSVFVSAGANAPEDIDADGDEIVDESANALALQAVATVSGASANSSARVGYGWVRAATSADAISGDGYRGQGGAQGRFRDDLVVTSPGLDGSPGTLRFQVRVAGSIAAAATNTGDAGTSATASWNVTYQIAAAASTRLVEGRLFEGFGGPVQTGELGGGTFVSPLVFFTFGTPFPLSMALNVEAGAREGAVASAQFTNALEWDGLVEVRSGGEPVAEFEVTSGSGANWAGAIAAPEVGVGAAGLAALGVLAALRARRRARPDGHCGSANSPARVATDRQARIGGTLLVRIPLFEGPCHDGLLGADPSAPSPPVDVVPPAEGRGATSASRRETTPVAIPHGHPVDGDCRGAARRADGPPSSPR